MPEHRQKLPWPTRFSMLMLQERIGRYLHPGVAEDEPGFRAEIARLSLLGLQVAAGVEIGISVLMIAAFLMVSPDPRLVKAHFWQAGSVFLVGVLSWTAAKIPGVKQQARAIGLASGAAVAGILVWFSMVMTVYDSSADDFIPGQMTMIMMVAIAALPLRPTNTLLFGFVLESAYVLIALVAQYLRHVPSGVSSQYFLFIFMLTLLAMGLTAVVYEQRRSTHQWYARTLRAADDLRLAEARNLLAQNAASVGRLAAALSHELNSPIGALVSGVDTLLLLASRQATAPANEQQRLVLLQSELRKSVKQSTDRLKDLVTRMQRFTNLDKAEVQSANVNDLLSDVAALLEPQYKGKTELSMDLRPVPDLICRPQQLSAVFSNLLLNSIDATDGSGKVAVSTESHDEQVEVKLCDNGRGLSGAELETIFDPGFKVTSGRVSTGNWSMFSSRQIIREHGGDISIQSQPGEGTCVTVLLPCIGCGGLELPT